MDFLYNNDLYILVKLNKITEEVAKQALSSREAALKLRAIERDNDETNLFERNKTQAILKGLKNDTVSEDSFEFIEN